MIYAITYSILWTDYIFSYHCYDTMNTLGGRGPLPDCLIYDNLFWNKVLKTETGVEANKDFIFYIDGVQPPPFLVFMYGTADLQKSKNYG